MSEQAQTFTIAKIPADGVGREVVEAGQRVLDYLAGQSGGKLAFAWEEFPWGCEYYDKTGRMMAEDGLEVLKGFDAIYFGAVGWGNVPDHISLWGLRLNITQNFDQWANIRPVKFLPGIQSPLRKAGQTELDWVVVRENSEGEYAGLGGRNLSARGPGNEVAVQTALFTEKGCERIMRFSFDLAWTVHGQLNLGHVYGYRLEPIEEGTLVTSYYDWSAAEQSWKDAAIFPVIPESALRATLGILARTVAPGKPRPAAPTR